MEQFEELFTDIESRAYRPDLWAVATEIMGGFCSDDGFWDFRHWLISKGTAAYKAALKDPKSVLKLADDDCRFENFGFVAIGVLEEKQRKQRRSLRRGDRALPVDRQPKVPEPIRLAASVER